jgi:hypothetical protein
MKKEFIPYEQALALKELGFDEPCFGTYLSSFQSDWKVYELILEMGMNEEFEDNRNVYLLERACSAPTFSQAFRWFREKYNLVHEISWSKYKGGLNFDYDVFSLVLPTDDELGDEDDDIASDKSMETYDSLVDKGFRHHESNTYEEAELACLIKLIEIANKIKYSSSDVPTYYN